MTDRQIMFAYLGGVADGFNESRNDVADVLNKIKAEIQQTANEEQKHDEKWAIGLRYAVKIIDKYNAERR